MDPQRSSSSSSIPRLSRLPVRNSGVQKNRAKSFNRHDKLSIDRNMTRPSSNLSEIPLLNRQRSGSLVRQTVNTPQLRSCRKSPLMSSKQKDVRPISDKKWQYDQLVKVRMFVSQYGHLNKNDIQSGISLEVFVGVMQLFFQLIDKRINITRENYIEEVPLNLKRYRYPSSVKPSLMKTVNTPHSWPHVLAILSWLTDTITAINQPVIPSCELEMVVDECVAGMFKIYSTAPPDCDEAELYKLPIANLERDLKKLVNPDEDKISTLGAEIEKLDEELNSYIEIKNCKMEKLEAINANTKSVNEKCYTYITESEALEKQIIEQHAKIAAKITKSDLELIVLNKTEEDLLATISSQPYSLEQKQRLTQEITDLKNTVHLGEDRQMQQRELLSTYDFQLSDLKQEMEANAYQYNNVISRLVLIDLTYKDLHIRESGFARKDTEDEIKEASRKIREVIIKLEQKVKDDTKKMDDTNQKLKKINDQLAIVKKEEEAVSKENAEINILNKYEMKKEAKEREKASAEISKFRNKLLSLKKSKDDISHLQKELKELEITKTEHLAFHEDLEERARYFFSKLEILMNNNLINYMNIMESLTANIIKAQDTAIAASRNRIKRLKEARQFAKDSTKQTENEIAALKSQFKMPVEVSNSGKVPCTNSTAPENIQSNIKNKTSVDKNIPTPGSSKSSD